jgi:hypothetical protein
VTTPRLCTGCPHHWPDTSHFCKHPVAQRPLRGGQKGRSVVRFITGTKEPITPPWCPMLVDWNLGTTTAIGRTDGPNCETDAPPRDPEPGAVLGADDDPCED